MNRNSYCFSNFRRWTLSGAKLSRVVSEFEGQYLNSNGLNSTEHHEQGLSPQAKLKDQVTKMYNTVANFGNPFMDQCSELLVLNTRDVSDEPVIDTVNSFLAVGSDQYCEYCTNIIYN